MRERMDDAVRRIRERNAFGALVRCGVMFLGNVGLGKPWRSIVFYNDGRVTLATGSARAFRVGQFDVADVTTFEARAVTTVTGGHVGRDEVVARLNDGSTMQLAETRLGRDRAEWICAQLNVALTEIVEAIAVQKRQTEQLKARIAELTQSQADPALLAKAKAELDALQVQIPIPPFAPMSLTAKIASGVVVLVVVGFLVVLAMRPYMMKQSEIRWAARVGAEEAYKKWQFKWDTPSAAEIDRKEPKGRGYIYQYAYDAFMECSPTIFKRNHGDDLCVKESIEKTLKALDDGTLKPYELPR